MSIWATGRQELTPQILTEFRDPGSRRLLRSKLHNIVLLDMGALYGYFAKCIIIKLMNVGGGMVATLEPQPGDLKTLSSA